MNKARLLPIRSGLTNHSAAVFLGVLLLVFVSAPFVQELPNGDLADAILVSLILCAGVQAVGAGRRAMSLVVLFAAPAILARWVNLAWPGALPPALAPAAYLAFVAVIVFLFIRFILRAPRVHSEVLCAAVATYLLLGLLWASAFLMVARTSPGSYSGIPPGRELGVFDALYLSIITLTTAGYGDIAPLSGPARMLAMTETVAGTMYMAVIVARLVSLYTVEATSRRNRQHEP